MIVLLSLRQHLVIRLTLIVEPRDMLDQHTIVYLYDAYFLPEHMYANHYYVFVRHFGNLLTTKQSFAIAVLIQDVQVRYVWLPSTTI